MSKHKEKCKKEKVYNVNYGKKLISEQDTQTFKDTNNENNELFNNDSLVLPEDTEDAVSNDLIYEIKYDLVNGKKLVSRDCSEVEQIVQNHSPIPINEKNKIDTANFEESIEKILGDKFSTVKSDPYVIKLEGYSSKDYVNLYLKLANIRIKPASKSGKVQISFVSIIKTFAYPNSLEKGSFKPDNFVFDAKNKLNLFYIKQLLENIECAVASKTCRMLNQIYSQIIRETNEK